MNIWIFNHHAQPPTIPGGTRHYDLAKALVRRGHQVTIFAAGFHYTILDEVVSYNDDGYKVEEVDGITFVWVKTYPYKKNNIKRLINNISYLWKLFFLIPKLNLEKPDVIIGTTVHPFAPLIAYYFSKKYKTPFIFEIRDLWPQSFIDMGVWKKDALVSKIFKAIEKFTVKRADKIIILSPKTKEYLKEEYNYTDIEYIPNSVDLDAFNINKNILESNETFDFLEKLKSKGKQIYMFTGAIVQSNSINMFVEIAQKLDIKDIQIVLVGKGQERDKYEKIIKEKKLNNISFLNPVKKRLVPKLLNHADVLLLVQGNVQWGSSNKLYDYLSARKPIITSLAVKHNDIVEEIACGFSAEHGNSDDLVEKIKKIYFLDKRDKIQMGNRAYQYVENNNDIKLMAKRLEDLCKGLKGLDL